MNLQIIDLKDIAKAYIQKAVYKISGEGSDPSINIPRIQLKHGDQNKVRFGMLYYWGEGENAYVAKDGTNYTIGMGIPADSSTDIPDGWTIISSQESGFAESSFPGAEYVGLTVYEVDLTVAKTFSVEIGANNFLRCYYVNEEKEIDGDVTFPSFFLPIDFVTDGDCGYVKEMEVADTAATVLNSDSLGTNLQLNSDGTLDTKSVISTSGIYSPFGSDLGTANGVIQSQGGQMYFQLRNASTAAKNILLIGTRANEWISTSQGREDSCALLLLPRYQSIYIGMNTVDGSTTATKRPIVVVDKPGANMAVHILGENCEWVTTTIDGVQRKVLMAKA